MPTSTIPTRLPTPCRRREPRGFYAFARLIGLRLEPFQRRIVRALHAPERETLVLIPKGNGKTTLLAAYALWHLLTEPEPAVYFGAASVAQARVAFDAATRLAAHPLVAPLIVQRSLTIRRADGAGEIAMVPSHGPRSHGIVGSLFLCDELWAHRDDALYQSMRSALIKRPDARLAVISTADVGADRPLVRLRQRAFAAPHLHRSGALTECHGDGLRALLWEADEDVDLDDLAAAKACNPASWITRRGLAEQRRALADDAYGRFHLNARVTRAGAWVPAPAWRACIGEPQFADGETVWIGVDVGGQRSATAVAWINEALHVGVAIFHGEEGVLDAARTVRELRARYRVAEVAYDPWRFGGQPAIELEREGLTMVQFPQTDMRMVPASQRLRDAVMDGRITLPDNAELTDHALSAVQRVGRRGWRIERPDRNTNIDALIALAVALDRAEQKPEPVRLLGWL